MLDGKQPTSTTGEEAEIETSGHKRWTKNKRDVTNCYRLKVEVENNYSCRMPIGKNLSKLEKKFKKEGLFDSVDRSTATDKDSVSFLLMILITMN